MNPAPSPTHGTNPESGFLSCGSMGQNTNTSQKGEDGLEDGEKRMSTLVETGLSNSNSSGDSSGKMVTAEGQTAGANVLSNVGKSNIQVLPSKGQASVYDILHPGLYAQGAALDRTKHLAPKDMIHIRKNGKGLTAPFTTSTSYPKETFQPYSSPIHGGELGAMPQSPTVKSASLPPIGSMCGLELNEKVVSILRFSQEARLEAEDNIDGDSV